MTLLVDTSVWSLALRRDGTVEAKEVIALRGALEGADSVVTTGWFSAARPVPFRLWGSA